MGFVKVDYYFYAAKTQENDGIVLFENYGLNSFFFFLSHV